MSCGVLDAFDNMELKQGRRLQAKHHLKMKAFLKSFFDSKSSDFHNVCANYPEIELV